jgi:hypothetical protein
MSVGRLLYPSNMSKTYSATPIEIELLQPLTAQGENRPPSPSSPWKPGFWVRLPWDGVVALLASLAAMIVMVSILVVSNETDVNTWNVSPAVFLATASTVANIALVFALQRGTEIAFWVKGLRPHATINDLHNIWSFGTGFVTAMLSGRSFNLIAFACIAVALAPINGPLLQRALIVATAELRNPVNLTIPSAQEFPPGYTGTISGRGIKIAFPNLNFSLVVKDYNEGKVYNLTHDGCNGQCTAKIKAAGYSISCIESSVPFDALPIRSNGPGPTSGYPIVDVFTTNFTFMEYPLREGSTAYEELNYTSLVKMTDDCYGNLILKQCTLLPALLESNIVLSNSSIGLDPAFTYKDDKVVRLLPANSTIRQGPASTHGGMGLVLSAMFNSNVSLRYQGSVGWEMYANGMPAFQYSNENFDPSNCTIIWSDPTENMLATARELAFRTALRAANSSNVIDMQSIIAQQSRRVSIYRAQYRFLAIAVLFTFIAAISIVPVYQGFWNLGRNVTLSPVEISKAFNAPALVCSDSNLDITRLLREVGQREIQYGAVLLSDNVTDETEGQNALIKLVMSDSNPVRKPKAGQLFLG